MKRIVSFLLSLIVLISSMSMLAFAEEGAPAPSPAPEVEVTANQSALGTAIGTGDTKDNPAANMTDGKDDTFFKASAEFGIDFTKEANVKVYEISVVLSAKGAYKLQYFRNNRWVDEKEFTEADFVAVEGAEGKLALTYKLDKPVITQQVRLVGTASVDVYSFDVVGVYLPNVGTKGEAYASSFKHFEWTPPHTFIDGKDFEEDWHGWEPQYPEVVAGANTSAGFSNEFVGVKFINREYYKVNQITFYMSMHNSSANPSMGYQDVAYKVEALVEGVWIVIAEFKDSDTTPKSYKDYEEAMKNDTSDYHIHSYHTVTLDKKVNTNNIRVSVSEFGKNYNGDGSLVFPYIYEMRVYAEEGEIPDIELPEGAVLSTNAAANSFPYASSAATNMYPFLAVDGDIKTGWIPKEAKDGETLGVRFDKTYTINNISLHLNDATLSSDFTAEAKVNGEWVKLFDGNTTDCFIPLPEKVDYIAQQHTYEFTPVETDEIRVTFKAPTYAKDDKGNDVVVDLCVVEIGANIVSSMTYLIEGGVVMTPSANEAGRYTGVTFNQKEAINKIKIDFAPTEENNNFFVQAFVNGIWQTIHTGKIQDTTGIFEVTTETDAIRVTYQDENKAPQINSITVTVVNYSGDVSSFTDFYVPCTDKTQTTIVDIAYGKTYKSDKVVIEHGKSDADIPFTVKGLVGEEWVTLATSTTKSNTTVFALENLEVSQVKVEYSANGAAIPAIKSLGVNVVGMKTFFLDGRYTNFQKRMAANGDIAVLGTAYANSSYPALCFAEYINDGMKFDTAPVWAPKLEEYSAGIDIFCGVKFDKEYTVDTVVVYAGDVGHHAGLGNEFEIQALVDGEYITVGKGFTCAEGKDYVTVYAIDSVKTTDIRILMTNTAVYIPTILEVEIYSNTDKVDPFVGHVISEKVPEVTVFKTETPRFDVAGLPN